MPQNMQHMHPGMMPNMQPGMQMNAQPHHNSPPIPTFTVDSYVGREKVNQVNVNDKYMGFSNKPPVQPNPPQHQKQVPVFTVDISSPGKLQEFMEERKFKVVERLAPSLTEKYQREDLEWSISEIKKSYEQKIKTLEEKQQEVCQEYFKEHHRVTLPQVKEIFKFVQRSIELNKEYSFDKNVELQQKSLEVINDIILNNYVVEDVAEEVEEQEAEHEPHNIPDYARYPQDQYYDPYSHKVDPHGNSYQDYSFDLRKDLDSFLKEIQLKKANMKEARQNVITKVQHLIDNIPHIEYAEIYGSYQTNLDLPWSDIDFVIFSRTIGGNECLDDLNMKFVEEKANNKWIKKIEYISTAYVPIIKIITEDSNFEVKVDITFKDETHRGSDWVKLVKEYMTQFPILSSMVIVIKQLLKVNNLNDPYSGGISSYALTLMIVAFLQYQFLNYGKGDNFYFQLDHRDLALTLMQFFYFYSYTVHFSFAVIQPCPPGEFPHNPLYMRYNLFEDKLMIVDPLNQNNNVGKSSFKIEEIKELFKQTYTVLSSTSQYNSHLYEEWKEKVFVV